MERRPCSAKGVIRGAWSAWEDDILKTTLKSMAKGNGQTCLKELVLTSNNICCTIYSLFYQSGSLLSIIHSDTYFLFCRAEEMWEELPASLLELFKARY